MGACKWGLGRHRYLFKRHTRLNFERSWSSNQNKTLTHTTEGQEKYNAKCQGRTTSLQIYILLSNHLQALDHQFLHHYPWPYFKWCQHIKLATANSSHLAAVPLQFRAGHGPTTMQGETFRKHWDLWRMWPWSMKQRGGEEEGKKQTNTLYSPWALSRQAPQMLNGTEWLSFGC